MKFDRSGKIALTLTLSRVPFSLAVSTFRKNFLILWIASLIKWENYWNGEKNETVLEMVEVNLVDKTPEEVKKELEDKGFNMEETEEKPVEKRLKGFEKE